MRARHPDVADHLDIDGINIGYESFGEGDQTVLLMPTWAIFPSRFWKFQVPYLARHYRVITFDGPGSGRSDRSTDPDHYTLDAHARYAAAVLEECRVNSAVVAGLSRGAGYTARLASLYPHLVAGAILVGSAIGVVPMKDDRAESRRNFLEPFPDGPEGWQKYNLSYWHHDYDDFIRFFVGMIFTEPYSTKAYDDGVEWGLETNADVLQAEATKPDPVTGAELLAGVKCPVLVVHGTDDAVISYENGVEVARLVGGELFTMVGSGHDPLGREPVRMNLLIRDFVERVTL